MNTPAAKPPPPDLGARIDAIEAALTALQGGEVGAEATLRALAKSVADQATARGFNALRESAQALEHAPKSEISARSRPMLAALREAAGTQRADAKVLVVGGDAMLLAHVRDALSALQGLILHAPTAAEARVMLQERRIMSVILHLVLPDMDGRAFLQAMRENSQTAAIPVLILAERLDSSLEEERALHSSIEHLKTPRDGNAIAAWIMSRLRRAPESAKSARRDPLTGQLNRAAFKEVFEVLQRECREADEPLSMAVLSLDSARQQLAPLDENDRETILQAVGLLLSRLLRTTDVVARWGLYEFSVLFPGEDQAGSHRAVEKVLSKIEGQRFSATGLPDLKISVASGVTLVAPEDTLEAALAHVDQLVYQASVRGGSQVLSKPEGPTGARAPRVLLLVRDSSTTLILKQLLEKDRFEVLTVDRWESDMVEDITKQRFNLVVIDEMLPPNGGVDALKQLRGDSRHNRMPIVMLVAGKSDETVAVALECGANDYVVRPFSPFAFLSRVHRLLSRGAGAGYSGLGLTKILIVSDDVKTLVLAGSSLQQRGGFVILLARGGAEAIARLQTDAPAAVLVDTPIADVGAKPFMQALAETAGNAPVDIIVAEAPPPPGEDAPEYPVLVRGRITKPIVPLRLAQDLVATLGLPATPGVTKSPAAQFNAEIQRVMRAGA